MKNTVESKQSEIDGLKHTDSGQVLYWIEGKPGFGVRVGKTRKAYIYQRDVNGKSERHTLGDCAHMKLAKAKKEADKLAGEVAKDSSPRDEAREQRADDKTLREAFGLYKSHLKAKKRSPRTGAGYWKNLNRYCPDWIDRPIIEITNEKAQQRHRQITEDHGPYSANGTMRAIRAIWRRARRQYPKLPEAPTINVDWNDEEPRDTVIEADDLPTWYAAIQKLDNPIRRDLYLFILFTGTRSEEARSIRWENVDLERGIIHIPKTKTKPFDLPLSDYLIELLKQRRECERTNAEFPASPFVFPADTKTGHVAEPKLSAAQARKFPVKFSVHVCRHTYITISENNVPMPLGHARLLVNHKIPKSDAHSGYNHPSTDDLRRSQQTLTDYLKAAVGPQDTPDNVVALHG